MSLYLTVSELVTVMINTPLKWVLIDHGDNSFSANKFEIIPNQYGIRLLDNLNIKHLELTQYNVTEIKCSACGHITVEFYDVKSKTLDKIKFVVLSPFPIEKALEQNNEQY